jgi:hypothetical protein
MAVAAAKKSWKVENAAFMIAIDNSGRPVRPLIGARARRNRL